ncbi:NAD(P)-dependent oxidoreductase [bacterium]|nr:NAD(P)-dependent oxidoreductase [bacterium]
MCNLESSNKIVQEDLEKMSCKIDFSYLQNSTVLVTGATGLIGSQIVLLLLYLNRVKNYSIKVIAMGRSLERLQKKFSQVLDRNNFELLEADVQNTINYDGKVDYIIHGASVTASKSFIETPVDTILTAIDGTKNMLNFAKDKQVKGFVYLSSMEVFGTVDGEPKLSESDYGYIDILSARSSYPESKRMCECLCASYAKQFDLPVKIARLAQTVGPGFKYDDNRMVVQFAKSVIENKDIVLLTEGKSKFCPIYTSDEICGIFTILSKGKAGEAYTVANSSAFSSVREIAEMVSSEIAQNKIKVVIQNNNSGQYPPSFAMNLDTTKLQTIGWSADVSLKEMYERLIESLK